MAYFAFSDKIIKNIFKNIDVDLERVGFLKRRDEFDLRILLELILFIRSLDKVKGNYFITTQNKYYFPIYAKKFYPFECFTFDIGLMRDKSVEFEGEQRKIIVFESTPRVELFYRLLNESIKNDRIEALHEKLKLTLKHQKPRVESYTLTANFFPTQPQNMLVDDIGFLNDFLNKFKNHEVYLKGKNTENKAIKKFREYCDYFDKVISLHKKSYIFNIEFLIEGLDQLRDRTIVILKKDFMNAMRSFRQLSLISGYMGFWDIDQNNKLCFRIMFCVPDIGIEADEWMEDIIYYWENVFFSKIAEAYRFDLYSSVRFIANPLWIAHSHKKLKCENLHIGQNNDSVKQLISEHAISYIVLSEFYYCPFELQLYLKSIALINEEQSDQQQVVESSQGGTKMYRVFRGSLPKTVK